MNLNEFAFLTPSFQKDTVCTASTEESEKVYPEPTKPLQQVNRIDLLRLIKGRVN
jgi:hypothetical protein